MKPKDICMKRIVYIITACAFSVSTVKAQQVLTLKGVSGGRIGRTITHLRIVHNEEQISKNNATPGNAGYLTYFDFSAGYVGNLDNIESKARETGEITKNKGVYDQTVNVGLNLNWTISTDSISARLTNNLKSWNDKGKRIPVLPSRTL